MGNKQCHYNNPSYERDVWGCQQSSYNQNCYDRSSSDMIGALDRFIGRKLSFKEKKQRKRQQQYQYNNNPAPLDQRPRNLQNLYGPDYNPSQDPYNVQYITPQGQRANIVRQQSVPCQRANYPNIPQQPLYYSQQQQNSVQDLPPLRQQRSQPLPRSRPVDEMAIDTETQTTCEHCNDRIIARFYSDHITHCPLNPLNAKLPCEFCGVTFTLEMLEKHQIDCESKVENLRMACDHCNEEIPLAELNYHMSTCSQNPKRIEESRIKEIMRLSKTNQAQECAICLLEMKKDDNIRFIDCAHKFHAECIEDWSKKRKVCPVCMTEFN